VVTSKKVRRRPLYELKRDPSTICLLQEVREATLTSIEVLMENFEFAFELDPLASSLPLSCGGGVNGVCIGGMRENECAPEEHEAGENSTAEDPGGTDLDFHG
jgi:hypothetical protein